MDEIILCLKSSSTCRENKPFQRWPMRLTTRMKHVLSVISYHAIKYSFTVFKHNKRKKILILELASFPPDLFQYAENRASRRAPLLIPAHSSPCYSPACLANANTWPRAVTEKNIWANRPEETTWNSHKQPTIRLWRCYQTMHLQELSQLVEKNKKI